MTRKAPPPATPDPVVPELGLLLRDLMKLTSRRSDGQSLVLIYQSGLTLPQLITMFILQETGALSISQIAGRIKLSRGTASHLVEQLVRRGYVTRTESELDRRNKRVSLQPKGENLVQQLHQYRTRELANVFVGLRLDLLEEFMRLLRTIVVELKASLPPGEPPGLGCA